MSFTPDLDHILAAEASLQQCYARALAIWAASVRSEVAPSDDETAPDSQRRPVNIMATSNGDWDGDPSEIVALALVALWCYGLISSLNVVGVEVPEPVEGFTVARATAGVVFAAIAEHMGVDEASILDAMARVAASPTFSELRDDFVASRKPRVSEVPYIIRERMAAALRVSNTTDLAAQRQAVLDVLADDGDVLTEVAHDQGLQAASVQNSATLTAALQVGDDSIFKVWIATHDSRTRPTHYAADGQRAPLNGNFTVGNDLLPYPGFPGGSPREVANCRCRLGLFGGTELARQTASGGVRVGSDKGEGVDSESQLTTNSLSTTGDFNVSDNEQYRTFTDQPIAFVGIPTSDGRVLDSNIDLSFRNFPLPVMWTKQTGEGHDQAYTVGVMESASIQGDKVVASGYMLNSPEANEACAQLEHTASRPSVDLAQTSWKLIDDKGNEISEEQWWEMPLDSEVFQDITSAELIGVTLVAKPAFGDTMLSLNATTEGRTKALVASAAEAFKPTVYSAAMFSNPNLTGPTLPTYDESTGRYYGHLACFGECHRSIQSACVITPKSPSSYANFHTSPAVRLDDGTSLAVGRLTVGIDHAADGMSTAAASAHYGNASACFALVRVGEDAHGVWFSGVFAPWASKEQIERGMSAPLSGDWRNFGQGLDLVAALAVNTPGFAVRGTSDREGHPAALVASLGPGPSKTRKTGGVTPRDLANLVEKSVLAALDKSKNIEEQKALFASAAELVGTPPSVQDEISELLTQIGQVI